MSHKCGKQENIRVWRATLTSGALNIPLVASGVPATEYVPGVTDNNNDLIPVIYGIAGVVTPTASGTTFSLAITDSISGYEYILVKRTLAASTSDTFYLPFDYGLPLRGMEDTSGYTGLPLSKHLVSPPLGVRGVPVHPEAISVVVTSTNTPSGTIWVYWALKSLSEFAS